MNNLFFVSQSPHLRSPAVINPGAWARGYDNYAARRQNAGDPWFLILEQAIELERIATAPHLPSRWKSSFLFPSLNDAMLSASPHYWGKRGPLLLWSAEICDDTLPVHVGDADLLRDFEGFTYPQIRARACAYWSSESQHLHRELITESPIRITKPVYSWNGQTWLPE
jgi:hypothetical protein